ncbi:hypothetical protein CCUG63695_02689 [Mycobacteroides franklinii]|uniref:DUF559 domain-containing protein n=2 Tax=Mycobacteroides franklinii TaxID=948102 RepID=A0A4R8R9F3_9MYCO|nr:hypothetical protein CCUG64054_02762 [Mycobacteroides franklinii]TDZ52861.1 hypothetical protein CCUG63697_01347 [Mycobacteroides franklinii]TDZ56268.1 hypothetical protein CCUG63696_02764 [Mycobacteroides franklinii]TDZ63209.1 hypothetical protein CCUG63695_02689 [Mycobacteroides franklinii]TDZ69606.1 hypothetical protein CCUG64056_02762 [Mycobacteroides franklinii]
MTVGEAVQHARMAEVFIGSEAVSTGRFSRHELRRFYRPIFRGVYVPKSAEVTLRDRTVAAWLATGRKGAIAGLAASALHGAGWVDHDVPIELVGVTSRPQDGLITRNERIDADEITRISGLPVTNRVRTAFDLGRYQPRARALGCLDALMRNQVFACDAVNVLADRYPKVRGVRQLRELLPLIDAGAQSPRESLIRLQLHDAGLPRAQTQVPVLDGYTPVAFLDTGWPRYRVAVEYDGDHHRKDRRQYVRDLARLRMLEERGWIVIRVIAEESPDAWIARVAAALRSRGCRIEIDKMRRPTRPFAA